MPTFFSELFCPFSEPIPFLSELYCELLALFYVLICAGSSVHSRVSNFLQRYEISVTWPKDFYQQQVYWFCSPTTPLLLDTMVTIV